jgi:hypothetical protein
LAPLLLLPEPSMAAGRMRSDLTCQATDKPMMYRCTVKLSDRKTGQPIEDAKFMVHTSMPSMPMAHNMPTVEGKPGGAPGVYRVMVHFEMAGEWAIDIRTTAPSRDQMMHKIMVHKAGEGGEHGEEMKHQMKKQD